MKARRKGLIWVASGLLVVGLAAGGVAWASGHHEGFVQRRITRHIDQALDAVGASPAQRDAVHAARDHVFATFAESRAAHEIDLGEAIALFQAERIDQAKLAELRRRHQAEAKKQGDAIVQALLDAHDALTAPQRQQLADYLRSHRPPRFAVEGMRPMFRHMINEHVDDVLDQIHASAEQRDKVRASIARVFDTMASEMGDHAADFDGAVALFTSDTVDAGKVDALRAKRQAKMQRVGDAITRALTDIHDTLDAGQREQVAGIVKSHHDKHGG